MSHQTSSHSVPPSSNSEEKRAFARSYESENLQPDIPKVMVGSSTFRELKIAYKDLVDESQRNCLLYFSVLPQDMTIKKKAFLYWWIGEGCVDSQNDEDLDEKGNQLFEEFIKEGIIEPISEKRSARSRLCRMNPLIRYALIRLADEKGFVFFDSKGNPTPRFSDKYRRGCLAKTEGGSSLREFSYGFRQKEEFVVVLLNISEPYVAFKGNCFSRMKNMKVLQLGSLEASANKLVEVDDTEFLEGLGKMTQLRYFSLTGIIGLTELPQSICKLRNLIILDLRFCLHLKKLPEMIASLSKLRWLDITGCYFLSHMPVGLAKLTNLLVLKGFLIRKKDEYEKYCRLSDLAALKNLKKLSITVFGMSTDTEELSFLSNFTKLESLSVEWKDVKNERTSEGNSEGKIVAREAQRRSGEPTTGPIKPPAPPSLRKLDLRSLPSSEMPTWVWQLKLASLEKLYVRGGKLSKLPVISDKWKIRILRLGSLSKLQMVWPDLRANFPGLTFVEIVECPKLTLFPCDENGEWVSDDSDPADG